MKARHIASAPWRGVKALSSMVFRRYPSWRFWRLPGSRFNYAGEVGDGTRSSTVMAPLLWIGRNFPEAPPMLWERRGMEEEKRPDHEMLRLLVRPNQYYTGPIFWHATVLDRFVSGNAYWLKIRDKAGRVIELWWAPSFLITPKGDDKTFITHYEYRPDGAMIEIPPEEIVHFRFGLDSDDPKLGRSPLQSVLREVFTDDEAATYTAALLRNGGVPGIIVAPDGDHVPADDDVKATKAYVKQEFGGDNRGNALVMSGPTKIQEFGFSPDQMNLKDLRRVPEERVTAVLGVPAMVAGLGAGLDRSTFTNFAEAREAAYEENIIPTQRIMAEELRFQLLPDFHEDPWAYRFGFDLSEVRVLQDDRLKQAERLEKLYRGKVIKRAEARRELGYEVTEEDEAYSSDASPADDAIQGLGRALDRNENGNGNGAVPAGVAPAAPPS